MYKFCLLKFISNIIRWCNKHFFLLSCVKEELKAELKSLRVKVDLLEARNVENEVTILKQGEKIHNLEEKVDAKLESAAFFSSDEHAALHSTDYKMKKDPTNIEEQAWMNVDKMI